ncbi:MAG: hypothetical protein L3J83_08145 [Proteobacteria bacterium]|nr:hypothetical protein [Pseudomonadota bacterium]
MKPIDLTSVMDYLDVLFEGKNPSENDIINAKKVYWRAYNTHLKRQRRKHFPILQVRFSKQELSLIKAKLEQGQAVSKYIHSIVMHHLNGTKDFGKKVNTALIEQQLFFITEYLSELIEFENVDVVKIEKLEHRIQTLEQIIQEVL